MLVVERLLDHLAGDLLAALLGDLLDDLAELHLQLAGQRETMVLFEDIGDAALARLAVDADHRLVVAADILRVDRQIRYRPFAAVRLLHRAEALLDRVLMRSGERGED